MLLYTIMARHKDLVGQIFHQLTVTEFLGVTSRGATWLCSCTCGGTTKLATNQLKKTQSCGCLIGKSSVRHGHARRKDKGSSQLYNTWSRARCSTEGTSEAWTEFETFAQSMGDPPEPHAILMRKDPTLPFSEENCRWATRAEVAANLRTAVTLTFKGKTCTILEWSERTGLTKDIIKKRLARGWSVEDTLTRPAGKYTRLDLQGERYGRLLVVESAGTNAHSQSTWKCRCDCGAEVVVAATSLRQGNTLSCGCFRKGTSCKSRLQPLSHQQLAKKLCRRAKNRADAAGIPYDLDPQVLVIPNTCPALGVPLSPDDRNHTPTLDRINPKKGYTKDNVAVISWRANSLKKDGTLEELEQLAKWLRRQLCLQ